MFHSFSRYNANLFIRVLVAKFKAKEIGITKGSN